MNTRLSIAALSLLLCGVPAFSPAAGPRDTRADYETLTQPYLEAYRAFLRARLSGSPDLDTFRQAYEKAYADYQRALRAGGNTAEKKPVPASETAVLPGIASPSEPLVGTAPALTPLVASASAPATASGEAPLPALPSEVATPPR